jgi:cytidylate kinase
MSAVPVIAIDGPAGSGKGTVAQRVAAALGYRYLDSGALYRLVAVAALRRGVPFDAAEEVARLAERLDCGFEGPCVTLDGDDVTDAIRTEAAGTGASPRCGRPCWNASGASASRPGWSPTAGTWARWSFPTPP